MANTPQEVWDSFIQAFRAELEATSDEILAAAWSSSRDRTHFYASDLLARVARRLNLVLRRELLLVDYALCVAEAPHVPIVFIESENDVFLADQEVRKLCSLSAPLRVLISVAEWDISPDAPWHPNGHQTERLGSWRSIVDSFEAEIGSLHGSVVAMIGEWRAGDLFRFYTHVLGGTIENRESAIMERASRVAQPGRSVTIKLSNPPVEADVQSNEAYGRGLVAPISTMETREYSRRLVKMLRLSTAAALLQYGGMGCVAAEPPTDDLSKVTWPDGSSLTTGQSVSVGKGVEGNVGLWLIYPDRCETDITYSDVPSHTKLVLAGQLCSVNGVWYAKLAASAAQRRKFEIASDNLWLPISELTPSN